MSTYANITASVACKLHKIVKFASLLAPEMKPHSALFSNGTVLHVYDGHIISVLSQALGVPYEIITARDNEFGVELPNGDWSGLVGMVKRGESDIAVGGVVMTEDRLNAVKFSRPYYFTEVTFETDNLQPIPKSLAISHPFSYKLWILLLAVVAVISMLLYIILKRKRTYGATFLYTLGNLLEQSVDYRERSTSFRVLTLSWTFGILVITNSYKATLLSFLSIPSMTGIRDISDLSKAAAEDSFQCLTHKGSYLSGLLYNSSDDNFRAIGKCLMRPTSKSMSPEEFLRNKTYKKAFLSSRSYIGHLKENYFISKDSLFSTRIAFPVSKSFKCMSELNSVINRLEAAGLILKILREQEFFNKLDMLATAVEESETNNKLKLEDLYGALLCLIIGYFSALTALVAEITAKYLCSRI